MTTINNVGDEDIINKMRRGAFVTKWGDSFCPFN